MGTPEFSVPVLEYLIEHTNVVGVVTKPDTKVGREQQLMAPPVKRVAEAHHIPVLQPIHIKEEYQSILELKPEIIITCAYGQIIPQVLLDYPKYGCINVHASLLPKLRGGAPIHRAIMTGAYKTGITIMYMVARMDAGDIIYQKEIKIEENDTAGTLHDKLRDLAVVTLKESLPNILKGNITRTRQEETFATYGMNITREDEHVKFNQSKRNVYNTIRGLNPWPGAFAILGCKEYKLWETRIGYQVYYDKVDGEIVAIYEDGIGVKAHDGEIIITKLQPPSKKAMSAREFLNGIHDKNELLGKVFE